MDTRRLRGLAAAMVLGLAAAAAGRATSLRPTPLSRAAARADAVVVGTVGSLSVRRGVGPSGRTRIFTDVDLRDLSVAAGSVPTRNVVLSVVGGTLDGRMLRVHGTPRFEEGRRYCVFLDSGEPLCGVAGWTQGVFRVERDASGVDRVFDHDGAPIAGVSEGRAVKGTEPMALGDFLASAADLAREGRKRVRTGGGARPSEEGR